MGPVPACLISFLEIGEEAADELVELVGRILHDPVRAVGDGDYLEVGEEAEGGGVGEGGVNTGVFRGDLPLGVQRSECELLRTARAPC